MPTIIPRIPSTGERFAQAFGALGSSLGQDIPQELMGRQERDQLGKLIGEDVSNIRNPDFQKQLLGGYLARENQADKRQSELAELKKHYPELIKRFGQEEADVLMSLPSTGAQTDYISHLLKQEARNKGFGAIFDDMEAEPLSEDKELLTKEQIPKKSPKIDYDKGLTPEERIRRQEGRYKTNLPLYTESVNRLQAAEDEKYDLSILEDLSPLISGLERLNINPKTGDLIIPAAASDDAQRYIKTINNFTRNAKQTYGSRITNFDLQQFLKRLPTLANSESGRKQIIKQMQIINAINIAHDKALQDVIDEHGGIRNIDYDRARSIAEKRTQKEINTLKSQFKEIRASSEREFDSHIKQFKSITPKDHVAVQRADGSTGYIPKNRVKAFMEIEGNKLL